MIWATCCIFLVLDHRLDAALVDFNGILSGAHIKVTATHSPPLLIIGEDADGHVTYSGLVKDVCDWLFDEKSNTTYEFIQDDAKDVGFHVKDMKMVLEGKADMSTSAMSPDPERSRLVDFTGAIVVTQLHFVHPYPREESSLYGIIWPFQPQVWYLLVATLVVMPVAFSAVLYCKRRLDRRRSSPTERPTCLDDLHRTIQHTIMSITEQGGALAETFLGMRFLNGAWFLMAAVLIVAYKSNLTSHLLIPKLEPMPSTFEELAMRPDLQVVVEEGSKIAEMMMSAESGPMKTLGDTLRSDSRFTFRDRRAGNALAASDLKIVYPGVDLLGKYLVAHMKQLRGRCHLTMAEKATGLTRSFHFALTKNGRYSKAISAKIQFIWESGLIHHWYQSYMPKGENCRSDRRPKAHNVPLKLEHLSGAFALWALLAGVSVFAHLLEHALAIRRRRRNRNVVAGP